MLEASELTCLPLIEEAAAAGLVAASPPGDHRFVHDLVRDAVEAGLAAAERVRLHRSAADAVERLHAGRLEPHLSDLARHWAAAAVSGERERAADWITRAAEEAMRRLAYEEAARLYRLALAVGAGDIDDDRRCRLLLGVAGALKAAGELSGRLPACREAAALARGLRRPDLLAEAALAMEGGESRPRGRGVGAGVVRGGTGCVASVGECPAGQGVREPLHGLHVPRRPRGGRPGERARTGDGRPLRRPRLRGRGAAGPSAGGVRTGGDGGAGDARRPDGRRRSREPGSGPADVGAPVADRCGVRARGSRRRRPGAGTARALRGRTAHPGGALAPAAGTGRPRAGRGPIRRRTAAGRSCGGRAPAVGDRPGVGADQPDGVAVPDRAAHR